MKGLVILVVAVVTAAGATACTRPARDECIEALPQKIAVGATQREAENALERCGCTQAFDAKTSTIQGTKPASRGWFIQSDWNALITLDSSKKVKSVVVRKVFTGP